MKAKEKKYEIDMCNGPILSKMLIFALPLMLSSILQLLFNAADIVVVGKYAGDDALAAVGSNTALINLLTNLFMGLSIGANVLAARYYGAREEKELNRAVHTTMLLSIYSGIILTIIGVIGAKRILIAMQTPESVLPLAVIYLRIYFIGMTAMMIYNFGSALLRAAGDTKRPLYYLIVAGIINVLLNLLFVIGFDMGVAGVAIATVVSQCISAFLIIRCLRHEEGGFRLSLRSLRIDKEDFLNIIKVGLPAGFQGVVFALSNVVIQSAVNSFGQIVVAGNTVAANIEGFVYVAMNSFHQATISFTSQNVGAGRYDRINKILLTAQLSVIVVGLVLGNTVVLFGRELLGIYSPNPEVWEAGLVRLGIISSTYALCGMMDVMVGSIRGMGYSVTPMIVSLVGACLLRLVWLATVFKIDRFHTINTVYVSYPITWIITFAAHVICFILIKRHLKRKLGI